MRLAGNGVVIGNGARPMKSEHVLGGLIAKPAKLAGRSVGLWEISREKN
jgi:hypothetical protein